MDRAARARTTAKRTSALNLTVHGRNPGGGRRAIIVRRRPSSIHAGIASGSARIGNFSASYALATVADTRSAVASRGHWLMLARTYLAGQATLFSALGHRKTWFGARASYAS
jgi:hypothetical protein